ncbi:MAG: electron transport complex subunit RsxC [Elusimicrobia bacterium]|nr:electron transport complex subunit RsxC [Elusimicrobiota bacterium]
MIIKKNYKLTGGIKIKVIKSPPAHPIQSLPIPEIVVLSLMQQPGIMLKPIVSKGDSVLTGQKIAESEDPFSVPLHSSVTGKILDIREYPHPVTGEKVESIVIESVGKDDKIVPKKTYSDYFRYTPHELLSVIKDCGIVGLGGEAFPAHIKLKVGKKEVDTLIVNAVESDPFLNCDNALIHENARTIVDGIKILMYILDISHSIIALRQDNIQTVNMLRNIIFHEPNIFIALLPPKYPQGNEKLLIKTLLGRTVHSGKLPVDAGVIVSNAATIYSICRAVKNGEPLISRVITVETSDLNSCRNLWVRNGTLIKDIVEYCGFKIDKTNSFVLGSIMRGKKHFSLDVPVIKSTRGVFILKQSDLIDYKNFDCFRCGNCVKACPVNLLPNKISTLVKEGKMDKLGNYYPELCLECGTCSFVCPSYRPIFEHIQTAKKEMVKKYDTGKFGVYQ